MEAGAVGFSTNQNPRHMREDKKPVASRLASKEELASLLDVLGEMNAGVVQLSGGGADSRGRIGYAADLARRTGRPSCGRASAIAGVALTFGRRC
jgi:N-acyl-D-aspartate/D-glutamate deacylase